MSEEFEPVRNLDHLHPALRRRVEEPERIRREVNRVKKQPPQVVELHVREAGSNGAASS